MSGTNRAATDKNVSEGFLTAELTAMINAFKDRKRTLTRTRNEGFHGVSHFESLKNPE